MPCPLLDMEKKKSVKSRITLTFMREEFCLKRFEIEKIVGIAHNLMSKKILAFLSKII